jgi:hypothetical protein
MNGAVARGPDGLLTFFRPNGHPIPEVPPSPAVPDDPVKNLRTHHDAQGLLIDAHTARAGWLGERLDVVWAIDVLHPIAVRSRPCAPEQASPAAS